MEPKRRRQLLIAALAVVIAGSVVYLAWPSATTSAVRRSSNVKAAKPGAKLPAAAPDVHLEALTAERTEPEDVGRDLFRFKPKPPPPPPPQPVAPPRPIAPPPPPVPAGPPPPPDIQLKFAGVLAQGTVKIAVLIDPLGHSLYAKEGETVDGRYKVWRIGVESLEISYVDGRGRKTIRMSGS